VESALAILSGLINLRPSTGEALLLRGLCHADMEEWVFAQDDLERAARLLPHPAPALLAKARILMRCCQWDRAWACLERARRKGTRTEEMFELRARVLERRGNREAAEAERAKGSSIQRRAESEMNQMMKYMESLGRLFGGKVMGVWWTGGGDTKKAAEAQVGGERPSPAIHSAPINVAIHPERMPQGLKVRLEVSCGPDVTASPGWRADPSSHP
jgi:tetratricopeptide (TPR) repeat protein